MNKIPEIWHKGSLQGLYLEAVLNEKDAKALSDYIAKIAAPTPPAENERTVYNRDGLFCGNCGTTRARHKDYKFCPTPPAHEDEWQQAVLNECMVIEGCYTEADPAGTVKCLIDWHVKNATEGAPTPPAQQHYEEQPDGTIHALDPADCATSPAQEDEPAAWLVRYTLLGTQRYGIHLHNSIADYKDMDPAAVSIPLYTRPQSDPHKRMFENAVRALAKIDEALGLGDDGCGDPDGTITAIDELNARLGNLTKAAEDLIDALDDDSKTNFCLQEIANLRAALEGKS